jgi:hypothetical protein
MTNHPNRGRVEILPVDNSLAKWRWQTAQEDIAKHPGWSAIGLIQDGALIQSDAGHYAIYRDGRRLSVNQDKAKAAHDAIRR